jgi:AhpD family alkylhydroperoxidase
MTNPAMLLPDANKGVQNIFKAVMQGGVTGPTLELVHLRASQINGCAPCVFGGVKSALKNGETDERLHQVVAWRESRCAGADRGHHPDRGPAGVGDRRDLGGCRGAFRRQAAGRDRADDRADQPVQPGQRRHP